MKLEEIRKAADALTNLARAAETSALQGDCDSYATSS